MSSRGRYQNQYRKQLMERIELLDSAVFMRADISTDLSGPAQLRLNRALKAFIEQGLIMKIAHGLYARAMRVRSDGEVGEVMLRDSFETVAMAALNRMGLEWEFGQAIQAYNRGETTQIPVKFTVRLRSRFRGNISAEGRQVEFEGKVNAR